MNLAKKKPLNGEKTHPLTPHALTVLRGLAEADVRRFRINPGVVDRLLRGGLVTLESRYSGGKYAWWVCITAAGRAAATPE